MTEITREDIDASVPPEEYAAKMVGAFGASGYNNAAYHACKILLQIASRDPVGFKAAMDAHRENPYGRDIENLMTPEERTLIMDGRYGLTGFQWGWAVNTAAYFTEQAPVPNGAIITIGVKEDDRQTAVAQED